MYRWVVVGRAGRRAAWGVSGGFWAVWREGRGGEMNVGGGAGGSAKWELESVSLYGGGRAGRCGMSVGSRRASCSRNIAGDSL